MLPSRVLRECYRLMLISGAAIALSTVANASDWAEPSGDSPCKVWGPSMLTGRSDSGKSDYIARYRGECRNGLAHGTGTLDWVNRWSPSHIAGTWQGRFHDGIFIGQQKVRQVSGLPGDRYLVPSTPIAGHNVLIVSQSTQTDPFDLCTIDRVLVENGDRGTLEDDTETRALLLRVARHVVSQCPAADGLVLELYEGRFELGPNRNWPANAVVTAGYSQDEPAELSGYSNRISSAVQARNAVAHRKELLENSQRDFRRLDRRSDATAWVSPAELDKNPFRWNEKRIGTFIRLERMISADRAVVTALNGDISADLIVNGVTPTTFPSQGVALIATIESNRARIDGYGRDLTQLRFIEAETCGDPDCYLWRHASRQSGDATTTDHH